MHFAIINRQIGHYHDARYRAAAALLDCLTVIVTANEGWFAKFLATDVGAYTVERLYQSRTEYADAVARGKIHVHLWELLDRIAPDAVAIAGWATAESAVAIAWARERGRGVVIFSDSQADDADRSFLRERVKARIVGMCDTALVGGPPHADYIALFGMPRNRVHLGYDVVDNVHFADGAAAAREAAAAMRAEHALPERFLLASARFIPKKNLPALARAYGAALRAVGAEAAPDLMILGDGDERSKIVAAAEACGASAKLHLPGYRGYDVLPAFYGLAEGFLHVSTREQWGLVINEAMAAGLPVIATRPCGATRTVIEDGVSGIVVEPDAASIEAGLVRLLRMSDAERAAMGAAAVAAIANWSPTRFASELCAAATDAAQAARQRRLSMFDRYLLRALERRVIDTVS